MAGTIRILDEISVECGRLAELRRVYFRDYAPNARRRGMALEGAWRSPPADVPGRPATLRVLWTVPDAAAWWAMRLADVEDKLRWWEWVDSFAIDRKRTVMADALTETPHV